LYRKALIDVFGDRRFDTSKKRKKKKKAPKKKKKKNQVMHVPYIYEFIVMWGRRSKS